MDEKKLKKWQRRKKDRAEEILNSTYKILSKEGRTGLSTRVIAKNAGVSVATIFRYFKDKDDLIEKCYHRIGFDVVNQFERDIEGNESVLEPDTAPPAQHHECTQWYTLKCLHDKCRVMCILPQLKNQLNRKL